MGVQVQSATKNGQGESLSILNRQFISFSYGGKNIEDFDLLAVFSNDRLDKEIYAPFNDTTTEQAELDGQMFWRSNFKAGQLSFNLATDGMTSVQLEEFKNWFQPGIERELILSEYHNRGILARVAVAPQISLLPFEKEVKVQIGQNFYSTKTSLYKGDITLSFVMDDPYWYSLNDIIEDLSEENLKIIYEDGIPHKSMIGLTNCFFSNNNFISEEETCSIRNYQNIQKDAYLYYCGTAPAYPEVSFNISLITLEDGTFSFPMDNEKEEVFIKIGEKKLLFTLPSLITSYNRALKIAASYKAGGDAIALRKELRDNLYNYYTRSYVMGLIDFAKNKTDYISDDGIIGEKFYTDFFSPNMKNFFASNPTLSCVINCKTGTVTVETEIKFFEQQNDTIAESIVSKTVLENAGNMIKSDYLTIDVRNMPKDGEITSEQCSLISTNSKIENLTINYKYMYL